MNSLLEIFTNLLQGQLEGSAFLALPIAFGAGVLISFTPCVYPMIPIIIGYIGGKGEESKSKNFFLSLFYVIGMAITYAGLGVFAALSGKLFGQIQTNPIAHIIVANIIILFGLSLLGVFTLPLPSFLSGGSTGQGEKGLLGALGMGLLSGFVAAPCTAAVLGVLLAYVATKQNLMLGVALLFSFARGVGVLLLLVGTFTGIIRSLPKAGPWMERIEKFFGWAMIVLGEYFLIQAGRLLI